MGTNKLEIVRDASLSFETLGRYGVICIEQLWQLTRFKRVCGIMAISALPSENIPRIKNKKYPQVLK